MSSTVRCNYTSLQWRYHCFRDARKCFRSEASVLFAGDSRIRRKYFAFCDFINDDRFRNASKKVKHGRNWMYDRELKLTVVNNINKTYVCKKKHVRPHVNITRMSSQSGDIHVCSLPAVSLVYAHKLVVCFL